VRTLDDLDVDGKRVLVRVDFNVPLDEDRRITDDARIRAALPTLRELREKGAKQVVLLAHLGRPKGRDEKLSLKPAADRLAELLGTEVALAPDYAALADVYVDDAFGAAHRAHASTERVAHLLPSAAGRLLEREVSTLTGLLQDPRRPLVAVVGGAKVTD
jgi:phosphoglycerate kinase